MKLRNNKTKLSVILWLLPLILLIVVAAGFNLNFGTDYASANVATFHIEDRDLDEIEGIQGYSNIKEYENGRIEVYYQNRELASLLEIEEKNEGLKDFQVFEYKPTTLIMIQERILFAIYATLIVYIIALAYLLKNKGIKREQMVWILLCDILLLTSIFVFTFGLVNVVGFTKLKINSTDVMMSLAVIFYTTVVNLFLALLFSKNNSGKLTTSIEKSIIKFKQLYLKYYIMLGLLFFGLLFINDEMLYYSPVLFVSVAYALFVYLVIKPIFFSWLINGSDTFKPLSKSKFFNKKW